MPARWLARRPEARTYLIVMAGPGPRVFGSVSAEAIYIRQFVMTGLDPVIHAGRRNHGAELNGIRAQYPLWRRGVVDRVKPGHDVQRMPVASTKTEPDTRGPVRP